MRYGTLLVLIWTRLLGNLRTETFCLSLTVPAMPVRPLPAPVFLTEAATARIAELVGREAGAVGLRVTLTSAGCSGLRYNYELAREIRPTDRLVPAGKTALLVDAKAELYLTGATLDYRQGPLGATFDFVNPNEGARCGCGESFTPRTAPDGLHGAAGQA